MIIEVDSSRFPIIIFKSLPVEVSDNDLDEYLAFFKKLVAEATEKIIIIHDINKARFLSSDQMARIRSWSLENKDLIQKKTIDSCVVTSSILSTLVIKALRLLMKSHFDSEIFTSMAVALEWANKKIIDHQKIAK